MDYFKRRLGAPFKHNRQVQVNVSMHPLLLSRLDSLAETTGQPRSKLVSDFVEKALAETASSHEPLNAT